MERNSVPKLMHVGAVCERYSVGRTKLYQLLRTNCIQAVKLGSRTLVSVESADRYFSCLPAYRVEAG